MCGRFVSPDEAAIERAWQFQRRGGDPFPRRFNVQPASNVPVLRFNQRTRELELVSARWGLIPHWWKAARPPNFTFNARIEEAASKPMWRDALQRTRCLVPAEGWYEWREMDAREASGGARRYRQPFFIHRRDGALLSFAGLLSRWIAPATGEAMLSCTVLTTAAAGPLLALHERMPVVVPEQLHEAWLGAHRIEGAAVVGMMKEALPGEELEHYPVQTLVNNGRVDGPELIEPLATL